MTETEKKQNGGELSEALEGCGGLYADLWLWIYFFMVGASGC